MPDSVFEFSTALIAGMDSYTMLAKAYRAMEEIKPSEIQLGNIISCFGKVEMVTGLVPQNGGWFICHSGQNQEENPIESGIVFPAYPVELTNEWKRCLNIDKYNMPDWVEYVHQAQNYMKWYANIDLLPNVDWSTVPRVG